MADQTRTDRHRRASYSYNRDQHRRSADRQMAIGWLNIQSLTNKTDAVSALISDRKLDVIALSETWHSGSDDVRLRLATPDNYAVADSARTSGRGGGVAVIFRKSLRCSRVPLPSYVTFESVCVRLTTASGPIVLLNVYRPGSVRPSAAFYDEMASALEQLVVFSCPVVVGGDINIHVHDVDDSTPARTSGVVRDDAARQRSDTQPRRHTRPCHDVRGLSAGRG